MQRQTSSPESATSATAIGNPNWLATATRIKSVWISGTLAAETATPSPNTFPARDRNRPGRIETRVPSDHATDQSSRRPGRALVAEKLRPRPVPRRGSTRRRRQPRAIAPRRRPKPPRPIRPVPPCRDRSEKPARRPPAQSPRQRQEVRRRRQVQGANAPRGCHEMSSLVKKSATNMAIRTERSPRAGSGPARSGATTARH